MRLVVAIVTIIVLAACSNTQEAEKNVALNPTGVWKIHNIIENNEITLTIREDSVMLFKAKKTFCPGTKYFVGVGQWRIIQDSILIMTQFTDKRQYQLQDIFPELVQEQKDSANVVALDMEMKLIATKEHLFDIENGNTRSTLRFYDRVK
jgi:hypothetical protein